jgi:hypothetical protein
MAKGVDEGAFGVCDTYVFLTPTFFIFGGKGADVIWM